VTDKSAGETRINTHLPGQKASPPSARRSGGREGRERGREGGCEGGNEGEREAGREGGRTYPYNLLVCFLVDLWCGDCLLHIT